MRSFLSHLIPDIICIVGFISLLYGVHLVYLPAMYIIGGLALIITFRPITNNNNINNNGKRKT